MHFTRLPLACFAAFALLLCPPLTGAELPILDEKVALSGEADPYNGVFPDDLRVQRLNEDGTVLFSEDAFTLTRLYTGHFAGVARRLGAGQQATDGQVLTGFQFASANDVGQIALLGNTSTHQNVYLLTGNVIRFIAGQGLTAAGDGVFTSFSPPVVGAAGAVALSAHTSASGQGVFLITPSAAAVSLRKIAIIGQQAPYGGTFSSFSDRVAIAGVANGITTVFFNASTPTFDGLFQAQIDGANPPTVKLLVEGLHPELVQNRVGQVVYRTATALHLAGFNTFTMLAHLDDPAPGGGTFSDFGDAALNDAGSVVFQATTTNPDAQGLYLKNAAGLSLIAQSGQTFGTGTFGTFGTPQINQNGLVAFNAELIGTSSNGYGLFLTDGATLREVVGTGDALAGSAVNSFEDGVNLTLRPDSFNSHGQLAFFASLVNGKSGLFVATPGSHLTPAGTGLWDDPLTWDFRIVPGPDTPVTTDVDVDAVLQGPPVATVRQARSVAVGGGTATTTLRLQPGSTLTARNGVQVLDHGILSGSGGAGNGVAFQSGSVLQLDLAGAARTGTPHYDFLRVDGLATLGGTLNVTTSGGFHPARGQSFDLLDLRTHAGQFASVNLPPLDPPGLSWDLTRFNTTGVITVSGATLFAGTGGVFTGTLNGTSDAPANAGAVLLTVSPSGRLTGTVTYAGRKYPVNTVLAVDGSGTASFGNPRRTLQVQLSSVNGTPQLAASVSTGGVAEAQATAARTNAAFATNSPFVGHYTVAFPPDPAHPEATFPQGTGYGILSVSTKGLAKLTGVLGDGTAFSAGGPLTGAGEFPVYAAPYALKGLVSGQLTLHGATAGDPVAGTLHWVKPATTPARKFPEAIDASVSVIGSGFQSGALLALAGGHATFHATGGNVPATLDKAVTLDSHNTFRADAPPTLLLSFPAAKFGLGTGSFRDGANVARAMKGVALQKLNQVSGQFTGVNQTGTFEIK